MANTIILKKSSTASSVPAAGSLQPGELAINLADKKLYSKTTGGTVILVGDGNAVGTVTSVAASGGTTGLTFTGSPVTTSGTLTLGGTLALANGGTGATTAADARTNLGATTVGANLFTLTNPSAIRFIRVNADNTVSALDAATFRTAIGAGTGSGTVTSVSGTGTVSGLTLSGTVTGSGSLTLGGTLSLTSGQVTTALGYTPSLGLQSSGQQVISASTSLTSSGNAGANILVVTGGITLTLPTSAATGRAITISNISGSDITLSYAGSAGTDGPTTLAAQTSIMLISDGGAPPFWRAFFAAGAFDGSKLFDAGFKDLPQNSRTAAYTLALSDRGKHISITTGGVTVPANSSVAFPIGTTIVIFNNSAASQSIAITTDTMYLAGTATTGTRTLAQRGLATLVKVATTTWVISGAGLT